MKIDRVSITWADNKVSYNALKNLQNKYPFVEWAILFSQFKSGQQRYPDASYRNELLLWELNLAAHFCGWYSKTVLETKDYSILTRLSEQFKRVQINYNFSSNDKWNLQSFLDFVDTTPEREYILQYNKSNSETLDKAELDGLPSNVHFLFDASGGRGKVIETFPEPFHNIYTGYSGGISVDNIESICALITKTPNEASVWIDMESGVRTENEFDLTKVETILATYANYIAEKVTK